MTISGAEPRRELCPVSFRCDPERGLYIQRLSDLLSRRIPRDRAGATISIRVPTPSL